METRKKTNIFTPWECFISNQTPFMSNQTPYKSRSEEIIGEMARSALRDLTGSTTTPSVKNSYKTTVLTSNVSYIVNRTQLEHGVEYELKFEAVGYDRENINITTNHSNQLDITASKGGLNGEKELAISILSEFNLETAELSATLEKGVLTLKLTGNNVVRKIEVK
jgi:HSP20 family molecular chaperone IbpA